MSDALRLLGDANVQWVLTGTLLLGLSSGLLGSFALLRRRSLMGDVLAHTALPGVAIAFLLTEAKSVGPLLIGAIVAGLVGSWCVDTMTRYSRIKEDTAQGITLSVFFGLGIVLLTLIAKGGGAAQSGLDRFLFGQAASLIGSDVKTIAAIAALLIAAVTLFFKEFKLLCFDAGFGDSVGLPMKHVDRLLMLLVVCTVAIGLQAVGVVLMAALLITPAAAARYWSERLSVMVLLAGAFGALSGAAGTLLSLTGARMATGPLIVLAATALFVISLLCAPQRGLLPKAWRVVRVRRKVIDENILRALYETLELEWRRSGERSMEPFFKPIDVDRLAAHLGRHPSQVKRWLKRLERLGWITSTHQLTAAGLSHAHDLVRRHRLWEMFLMYEADFAVDHVDRDADTIEHHLPRSVVEELERRLKMHHLEPALPDSVHEIG